MTVAELEARLTKVNAAIDFVLNGNAQSATIAGRGLTALSLTELDSLRRRYEWELSAKQQGGIRPIPIRFSKPASEDDGDTGGLGTPTPGSPTP